MIKIVTDSTANLAPDTVAQYDIKVVPLKVIFGDRIYHDNVDLSTEEFYRLLETSAELPNTSQPSSAEFFEVYSGLLDGDTEIISIHISSELSGTINSAHAAREMLPSPERVHVVDSRFTALATGMMAIAAAESALAGHSIQDILAMLDRMIQDTALYFAVDTLKYLEKGGRIGGGAAFLGTVMKIKPLLCFNDGRVDALEKVRTKSKSVARLVQLMEERVGPDTAVWAGVLHTNCRPEAEKLMDLVASRFNCVRSHVADAGPTLGTHAGPGVLGLAMVSDPASY